MGSHSEKTDSLKNLSGPMRPSNDSEKFIVLPGDDLNAIERASTPDTNVLPENSQQDTPPKIKTTAENLLCKVPSVLSTRSIVDPSPPPDGGLKAWTQVAMGWIVLFTTWGWINSYGAFQTYYTHTLGVSASTVSWIGGVQNWSTFVVGAFSGRLLDAGYYVPTLFIGAFIQILGIFMMSLSTQFWQLLLTQGFMTGVGGGIFFTPSVGLMGTYFSKHRAIAIGIATTGNSAGGTIYPVLVQQLLPRIGFAWTARVLGFLNLACLSLVFIFMRPRLPPRKSGPLIDVAAFKHPSYALFVAGIFFLIWSIYYTFYYLSSFANETIGFPLTASTTIIIVLNAAGVPARLIPPLFADKYGQLNTLIPMLALLTLLGFCWIPVHSTTGLYVFTVFYGIAAAGFQCLIPSTVAAITPNMNMFGTWLGMAFSALSFAALTGPPIGGALQSADNGGFLGAQLWAAVSALIGLVLITASRLNKTGWNLLVKC